MPEGRRCARPIRCFVPKRPGRPYWIEGPRGSEVLRLAGRVPNWLVAHRGRLPRARPVLPKPLTFPQPKQYPRGPSPREPKRLEERGFRKGFVLRNMEAQWKIPGGPLLEAGPGSRAPCAQTPGLLGAEGPPR